jgi:hypothetical protein
MRVLTSLVSLGALLLVAYVVYLPWFRRRDAPIHLMALLVRSSSTIAQGTLVIRLVTSEIIRGRQSCY